MRELEVGGEGVSPGTGDVELVVDAEGSLKLEIDLRVPSVL